MNYSAFRFFVSVLASLFLVQEAIPSTLTMPAALRLSDTHSGLDFNPEGTFITRVDQNGRPRFVTGAVTNLWRRLVYLPESGTFEFDLVVPKALPGREGYPMLVAQLEQGGKDKVISAGDGLVLVHDLESGELERISAIGMGLGALGAVVDLDGDGSNEFIFNVGRALAIYDKSLSRQLATPSLPSSQDRIWVGNLDGEPGVELLVPSGEIFKFSGFELHPHAQVELNLAWEPQDVILADVNCNGTDEIVAFYYRSTAVIDPVSGDVLWHVPFQSREQTVAGRGVADLTGDGCMDVIVAERSHPDDPGSIVALRGRNGAELVRIPNIPGTIPAVVAGADFTGDGKVEILTWAYYPLGVPDKLYLYDLGTGALKWSSSHEVLPGRGVVLGDSTGDGEQEILFMPGGLFAEEGIRLYSRQPLTFQKLWTERVEFPPSVTPLETRAIAIDDLDGTGVPSIVVGTSNNGSSHVWLIDGRTREVVRGIPVAWQSTVSSILIEDVDGDGAKEIVVGTRPFSTAGETGIYVVKPASQEVAQLYQSPGFREVYAMELGDVGNGVPEIVFVEDHFLTTLSFLVRVRPDTGEIVRLPPENALSMILLDVSGNGAAEIIIGRRDGYIDVLDGLNGHPLSSTKVCSTRIYALARNTLDGAGRAEAYFACHDRIGAIDFTSGDFRILTGVIGDRVGIGNALLVSGTSTSEPRITATTYTGWIHLVPAPGVAPALIPPSTWFPPNTWVFTHWRRPAIRAYELLSFDGQPVDVEVIEPPRHGELASYPTIGPAFEYRPRPYHGRDHFVVRAVSEDQASVPVTILVNVTNRAPFLWESTYEYTVEVGESTTLVPAAKDDDGDKVLYVVVDPPKKGVVVPSAIDAPLHLTYTPNEGELGEDVFSIKVFDQVEYSPVSTVKITIVQPQLPPSVPPPPTPPPSGGGGGSLALQNLLGLLLLVGISQLLGPQTSRKQDERRRGRTGKNGAGRTVPVLRIRFLCRRSE